MAWQVTDVRHTSGGMPGSLWYHGFAIVEANTRSPVVSFGYADQGRGDRSARADR
jgi:hypothetical protein